MPERDSLSEGLYVTRVQSMKSYTQRLEGNEVNILHWGAMLKCIRDGEVVI